MNVPIKPHMSADHHVGLRRASGRPSGRDVAILDAGVCLSQPQKLITIDNW